VVNPVTGYAKTNSDEKLFPIPEQSFIFDGNEENFDTLVIDNMLGGEHELVV
jgi:hypothetical protein